MERLKGFSERHLPTPSVLSIGNFDGVHRGHQAIVQRLVSQAKEHSVPAAVLTFEPHPAALLHPERLPPRLTTPDQKADLLEQLGVDFLVEYPTDWNLLHLEPAAFFEQIVTQKCQAVGLVEGPNFFFGKGRSGNVDTLRQLCEETGRRLTIVSPTTMGEDLVSSSRIRQALRAGEILQANEFLGRRYSVSGVVVSGAQRGRTLGFPTANLHEIATMLPGEGVYAAWGITTSGRFPAAVNIGPNPTFEEITFKVEAHLIGYTGDLYGQSLELEFVERLRDLRPFGSVEELKEQITRDAAIVVQKCRQ
ncbi:MAG TPA: bifunctional riboflavin kinase/FAD synthetase [Planctomicrobium sp.]|nr:bifunctional riboflavin kinase/FAD synthetase [Planctomicrobium sp.]